MALATAPPGPPLAQADIVVTGSRLQPSDGRVLGPEQLDDQLAPTLSDALSQLPGVHSASAGGLGGPITLFVRGGDPNATLVLINGVRVNDPTTSQGGGFDFAQLDPGLIEAIDFEPTAASAIHGSDALAGVINVQLKSTGTSRMGTAVRASSEGLQLRGQAGPRWSGGGAAIGASWTRADHGGSGEHLERSQVLASVSHALPVAAFSAFLLRSAATRTAFPEASGGPRYSINRKTEDRGTKLTVTGFRAVRESGGWRHDVTVGWSSQITDLASPEIAEGVLPGVPAFLSVSRFRSFQMSAYSSRVYSGSSSILAGIELLRESGGSRGTIDFGFPIATDFSLQRTRVGAYGELNWRPSSSLKVDGALRYDVFAQGPTLTPRISATLVVAPHLTTTFSYGEGYKLPSLYALGQPLIGNPDIRSETSRFVEFSAMLRVRTDDHLKFSIYRTAFRDLIDFDVESFRLLNRREVVVTGVELAWRLAVTPEIVVQGWLAHVDIDSDEPLRGRPDWQFNATAAWQASSDVRVVLSTQNNSDFRDVAVPLGNRWTDGRMDITVRAAWTITDQLKGQLEMQNVMDRKYEYSIGFPGQSRILRLGVAFAL